MRGFRRVRVAWIGDELNTHAFRFKGNGELAGQSECGLPKDPLWKRDSAAHCDRCKFALSRNRR